MLANKAGAYLSDRAHSYVTDTWGFEVVSYQVNTYDAGLEHDTIWWQNLLVKSHHCCGLTSLTVFYVAPSLFNDELNKRAFPFCR
jgi:hypothetical protein